MKKKHWFLKFLLIITIVSAAITFYAFKIEPYRLTVNKYTMNQKEEAKTALKVVHISDLHIKPDFTYENLIKVVDEVNKQEADIVVFTGDLYDNYSVYNDDEQIVSELSRVEAKYEKIAVWGNRDHGGGAEKHYPTLMYASGFTLLKNENKELVIDNKVILITGLDDDLLGDAQMPFINTYNNYAYRLMLSHEPDVIDYFPDNNYDLTLSGHSHGGQINIPFMPFVREFAVSNTELASKYMAGFYPRNKEETEWLYVNTGIGTTHISARLGVVPEITVFTIYI